MDRKKIQIYADLDWALMGIDEAKKDVRKGELVLAQYEINGIVNDIKKIEKKIEKWTS